MIGTNDKSTITEPLVTSVIIGKVGILVPLLDGHCLLFQSVVVQSEIPVQVVTCAYDHVGVVRGKRHLGHRLTWLRVEVSNGDALLLVEVPDDDAGLGAS